MAKPKLKGGLRKFQWDRYEKARRSQNVGKKDIHRNITPLAAQKKQDYSKEGYYY